MNDSRPIVIAFAALVYGLVASAPAWATEAIAPTFGDVQPRADAEATYVANAYAIIHVGHTGKVNEDGSSWFPTRDLVYRLTVAHDAFFVSLGRPDLARQVASRHATGVGLEVGGSICAVAGVIGTPWMIYKGSIPGSLVGLGLFVGGVVARSVGKEIQKPSFPEDQALDMTDRYNQALRTHLGLGTLGATVGGRF